MPTGGARVGKPLWQGSKRNSMMHGSIVCFQILVWMASRTEAHAQIVCTRDGQCIFTGNGTDHHSTTTRVEENSKYIALGIVAGIVILVAVNLVICIARCFLAPRLLQGRGNYLSSGSMEEGSVTFGRSRPGSVYVVNPGGSLKIGREDSKKGLEGSDGEEDEDCADLCEQGLSQAAGDGEQQQTSDESGIDYRFGVVFPRD